MGLLCIVLELLGGGGGGFCQQMLKDNPQNNDIL